MSVSRFIAAVLLISACGDKTPTGAAPASWRRGIDPAVVGPACASMIGASYRPRVPSNRRSARHERGIDLDDPTIPRAIAALDPLEVQVSATEVQIVMGEFATGHAHGEYDWYGLVCLPPGGSPSRSFRSTDPSGTFLRPLGHGLHFFDSIL